VHVLQVYNKLYCLINRHQLRSHTINIASLLNLISRLAVSPPRCRVKIALFTPVSLLPGVCLPIHHVQLVVHRRTRIPGMHSTVVMRRLGRWLRCRHLYLNFVRMQLVQGRTRGETTGFTNFSEFHKSEP